MNTTASPSLIGSEYLSARLTQIGLPSIAKQTLTPYNSHALQAALGRVEGKNHARSAVISAVFAFVGACRPLTLPPTEYMLVHGETPVLCARLVEATVRLERAMRGISDPIFREIPLDAPVSAYGYLLFAAAGDTGGNELTPVHAEEI